MSLNDYINEKDIDEIDEIHFSVKYSDLEILQRLRQNSLSANHDSIDKNYQLEKERYQSQLASRYVTGGYPGNNEIVEDARV